MGIPEWRRTTSYYLTQSFVDIPEKNKRPEMRKFIDEKVLKFSIQLSTIVLLKPKLLAQCLAVISWTALSVFY